MSPSRGWVMLAERKDVLAVISAGGAAGSVARWAVSRALQAQPGQMPWSTFLVNVSGSLVLGALMVLVNEALPPSRYVRPFLGIGVLGGFTTFSTAMLDTRDLVARGDVALAALYLLVSVTCGLLAVWVGVVVTRWAVRPRSGSDDEPGGAPR